VRNRVSGAITMRCESFVEPMYRGSKSMRGDGEDTMLYDSWSQ
jgi:hypothetical protein